MVSARKHCGFQFCSSGSESFLELLALHRLNLNIDTFQFSGVDGVDDKIIRQVDKVVPDAARRHSGGQCVDGLGILRRHGRRLGLAGNQWQEGQRAKRGGP